MRRRARGRGATGPAPPPAASVPRSPSPLPCTRHRSVASPALLLGFSPWFPSRWDSRPLESAHRMRCCDNRRHDHRRRAGRARDRPAVAGARGRPDRAARARVRRARRVAAPDGGATCAPATSRRGEALLERLRALPTSEVEPLHPRLLAAAAARQHRRGARAHPPPPRRTTPPGDAAARVARRDRGAAARRAASTPPRRCARCTSSSCSPRTRPRPRGARCSTTRPT